MATSGIPIIPETETSSLGLESTFEKKSSGSGSLSTNIHLPYMVSFIKKEKLNIS